MSGQLKVVIFVVTKLFSKNRLHSISLVAGRDKRRAIYRQFTNNELAFNATSEAPRKHRTTPPSRKNGFDELSKQVKAETKQVASKF